jgi:hypothetical protein
MKRLNFLRIVLSLCLVMVLGGCKSSYLVITTQVKPNGALLRTMEVVGDSTGVPKMSYPMPRDSSWVMTCVPDSDKKSYTYTLHKLFSSADELNKELGCRRDTIKVNDSVSLKKRFRWFFTYYQFKETIYRTSPFTLVPIEKYLTPEELKYFNAQKDTMNIKDKVDEWEMRSIFESYYQVLKTAVSEKKVPLTTEQLELSKEDLYKRIVDWKADDLFSEALLSVADSLFSISPSLLQIQSDFAKIDTTWNQYLKFQLSGDEEYEFYAEMPGRIIDADSTGSIEQSKVWWKLKTESFQYRDVVMRVESRRFNRVPTIIFGLFILALIILLWISAVRARRRKWLAAGLSPAEFPCLLLKPWISALFMAAGAGLAGYFSVVYIIFFTHPVFILLPPLPAKDRVLFLSLAAVGVVLFTFGLVHLIRWLRRKKQRQSAD